MSFARFAAEHGLMVDAPAPDGRWHRVPTQDHPRKKNGAYNWDGHKGAVINWATMLEHAVYRSDGGEERMSEEAKRRLAQMSRENAQKKRAREDAAAVEAADLLQGAHMLVPRDARAWKHEASIQPHPYLMKKGLFKQPGLVIDVDHRHAPAGSLLVPMHDAQSRELLGAQIIQPDGTKKFLPGQRAKGAVHWIGREREQWLVEGYATGLSVRAALQGMYRRACVVVCFSAGNLTHVASLGIGTHVFADHDESRAGEDAAQKSGLPYCMSPSIGDANDLHKNEGLHRVQEVMRGILNG